MSNAKTPKGTELPLITLKGKPYLQVAYRFVWFNEVETRFSINTDFLVLTDEQTVVKAHIKVLGPTGELIKEATATKRETKKDFSDHTEKAETGAIGRALAMLGYGTQFTVQDMDEGERLADSPVELPKTPPNSLPSETTVETTDQSIPVKKGGFKKPGQQPIVAQGDEF